MVMEPATLATAQTPSSSTAKPHGNTGRSPCHGRKRNAAGWPI